MRSRRLTDAPILKEATPDAASLLRLVGGQNGGLLPTFLPCMSLEHHSLSAPSRDGCSRQLYCDNRVRGIILRILSLIQVQFSTQQAAYCDTKQEHYLEELGESADSVRLGE